MRRFIIFCLVVVLITLLTNLVETAPRQFTCMSYMEDDKSLQDDDDFEDYGNNDSSNNNQLSVESPNSLEEVTEPTLNMPQQRVCPTDYTFCFSLWRHTANGSHIEKQGCWKESTERNATCSQTECTSSAPTSRNNSLYYCCCSGDVCNQHVAVVEPAPLELAKNMHSEATNMSEAKQLNTIWATLLLWCTGLATTVIISAFLAFFYCRSYKEKPIPEQSPLAPSGPGYSSNLRNVDNMNLISMLGSGKYGTVMKGLLHEQEVAVKIFPEAHYQYYINERNIYSLPLMDCPALLTYFGFDERHTMDGKMEYQIVLSLAPFGCLQDWLIANTMDFEKCCGLLKSITRGLSHLHTELRIGEEYKPCIAHRDLNTRNVLVKHDLTCCIADFGFALKVFGSKYEYKGEVAMAETKSINEVGTLRYMAPELLEGAVNLRDCETSLKQMDVYSLGLVLWEVATRCSDFYAPGQLTPPYKAPYEQEIGPHPTFDQMQALVVRHKARPLFPAGWGGGAAAKLVRDTCEDCWDHDAEARLTSLCAEERMQEMSGLRPRLQAQPASPLLNTNNLSNELVVNVSQEQNVAQQVSTAATAAAALTTTATATVSNSLETSSMLQPPPNQQVPTEKNHMSYTQQQLQPYQGRNPCMERNLAPLNIRTPQVLVEKSKKHSFQMPQEHSFSCLEDDVSVEELIAGGGNNKHATSNLGQGFPKQQNTDRKLRGWHGVRALIHKKLFRKDGGDVTDGIARQLVYGDEKCNLVDNRFAAAAMLKGLDNHNSLSNATTPNHNLVDERHNRRQQKQMKSANTLGHANMKRPNNLDLSPMQSIQTSSGAMLHTHKSNLHDVGGVQMAPLLQSVKPYPQLQSTDQRTATPAHIVPRSLSASLIKHMNQSDGGGGGGGGGGGFNGDGAKFHNNNNNNNCIIVNENELKLLSTAASASSCKTRPNGHQRTNSLLATTSGSAQREFQQQQQQMRRQHSLEVFREVFSGRGSTERLRDPSQRVKTPGDVPPSVRKVRASKTLSLYDDRMMDSSMLNIL